MLNRYGLRNGVEMPVYAYYRTHYNIIYKLILQGHLPKIIKTLLCALLSVLLHNSLHLIQLHQRLYRCECIDVSIVK